MRKILTKEQWRKRKRMKKIAMMSLTISLFFIIVAICIYIFSVIIIRDMKSNVNGRAMVNETLLNGTVVRLDYLTPNEFSRPQEKLERINGVVIHYTANPGTTAEQNRNYFEGLAKSQSTYASSHYIIGLEGEIIQCIPLTEISYASNDRNQDTIAIECCHPDQTGEFNEKTYKALVSLVAALSIEFNLKEEDIIRHYDVTGKLCPVFYVEHEDEWLTLKETIMKEVLNLKLKNKEDIERG